MEVGYREFDMYGELLMTDSRTFKPNDLYWQDIDLDLVENPEEDWIYIACDEEEECDETGRLPSHTDSIVIAVESACRDNGDPVASAGIFVGPNNPYNYRQVLKKENSTRNRAELVAGILGLYQAIEIKEKAKPELSLVTIKADSEYLIKGLTEGVLMWRNNGYTTDEMKEVVNCDLFKIADHLIEELNDMGVDVKFWQVSVQRNHEADELANKALGA